MHVPIFRIFYSGTFTVLLFLCLGLQAISPADVIYQSYRNNRKWNIVIIAGVYLLVLLMGLFIYATRLYTTRAHLAAIPKSRLPLDKGHLPRRVRRLVLAGIDRSATIAYRVRPRDLTSEELQDTEIQLQGEKAGAKPLPTWGEISHPGWSAPHDPNMPNMHYVPVLQELPYLLEARAVSLAPADPLVPNRQLDGDYVDVHSNSDEGQALPDPTAVMLLQRHPSTSLRAYLTHLVELGVLETVDSAADFLARYDSARYSSEPLYERDFRDLMDSFARLLDAMLQPDPKVFADMADAADMSSLSTQRISDQTVPRSTTSSRISLSVREKRRPLVTRTAKSQDRPSRSRSRSSSDSSTSFVKRGSSYATPGPHTTPFYTPYPAPMSTRTASTGSLAGSEGTAHTAPSRLARTIRSGKRTSSAYSRRSQRSRRRGRSRSRSAFGLGLDMPEPASEDYSGARQVDEHPWHAPPQQSRTSAMVAPEKLYYNDNEDGAGNVDDDGGSVMRYSVAGESLGSESIVESLNSGGSVVRRRGRES